MAVSISYPFKEEKRKGLHPIEHDDIWEMYKQQKACFWTAEEIDLYQDTIDWDKLKHDEQYFIENVLAFFAASDGIVLENLADNFIQEIPIPEVKHFYAFQILMENIHSETYSLLIDSLILDQTKKTRLFNAIHEIPAVKLKADWAQKWMNQNNNDFARRLIGFCAVEGLLFSGSFCAIFWLKKRGLMPGLTFSNELISRDEGLHTEFGIALYHKLNDKLPESVVHEIIMDAVKVEVNFITVSLPCRLIGMNAGLMKQYIEYVADRLLVSLGYNKVYRSTNPFDWMDLISVQGKTNFFEKRVGDYQKAGIMATRVEQIIDTTEEADF